MSKMTAAQRKAHNERRRVTPQPKTCEVCGTTFTPARSDAKTCSAKCRMALSRATAKRNTTQKKPKGKTSGTSSQAVRKQRRASNRKPKPKPTPDPLGEIVALAFTPPPMPDPDGPMTLEQRAMHDEVAGTDDEPECKWKMCFAPATHDGYCKHHAEAEAATANRDNQDQSDGIMKARKALTADLAPEVKADLEAETRARIKAEDRALGTTNRNHHDDEED